MFAEKALEILNNIKFDPVESREGKKSGVEYQESCWICCWSCCWLWLAVGVIGLLLDQLFVVGGWR